MAVSPYPKPKVEINRNLESQTSSFAAGNNQLETIVVENSYVETIAAESKYAETIVAENSYVETIGVATIDSMSIVAESRTKSTAG